MKYLGGANSYLEKNKSTRKIYGHKNQTPKQNIADSLAYYLVKAKLNTGLATPARKSESVARAESFTQK